MESSFSWLIGVIITAACIVGIAAIGELVDDRILAALGTANGAFLVLDAGGLLGSGMSITHWKLCAAVSALSPHSHSCQWLVPSYFHSVP